MEVVSRSRNRSMKRLIVVAGTLLIRHLLARKDRDVILHGPDHKPSNGKEDKQDDDNNGNGDISFHR